MSTTSPSRRVAHSTAAPAPRPASDCILAYRYHSPGTGTFEIGQYLIWGRFVYAAWKKKRTYYAVTNRRVIVVQYGWSRKTASAYLDTLPTLMKESGSGTVGTLRFAQPEPVWSKGRGWSAWDSIAPTLAAVRGAELPAATEPRVELGQ